MTFASGNIWYQYHMLVWTFRCCDDNIEVERHNIHESKDIYFAGEPCQSFVTTSVKSWRNYDSPEI